MILAYLKPRTQLVAALLVPLISIFIGLFLVWPAVVRLREVEDEVEVTKRTIGEKEQLIALADGAAKGRPLALAVALADEQEPIVFLRQLAAICTESQVSLLSVRATLPPPLPRPPNSQGSAPSGSAPPPNPAAPAGAPQVLGGARPVVPPAVEEVTDQVTVEGSFGAVLSLLVRLEGFDRILSVSQCRLHTGLGSAYPRLQAVFTLSRFVAKSSGPPTGAATNSPAPTG